MPSVRPRYATRHRHTITSIFKIELSRGGAAQDVPMSAKRQEVASFADRLSAAPPALEESVGGLPRGEFALIPPLAHKTKPGMERHSAHGVPYESYFPAMKKDEAPRGKEVSLTPAWVPMRTLLSQQRWGNFKILEDRPLCRCKLYDRACLI